MFGCVVWLRLLVVVIKKSLGTCNCQPMVNNLIIIEVIISSSRKACRKVKTYPDVVAQLKNLDNMWQPDNIKFVKIIFSSLHSINAIYHKLSLYDFSWKGIYLCISFHYELKRSEWLDKKKLLINKQLSFRSHWDWWH